MLAVVLFISGGEIFLIVLFILIFFGADQIPKFARMMGKAANEFKKATDDIKREFNDSTSGVLNEIRSIQNDLTDTLTKEIAEPMQKTANETEKTFKEYEEHYNVDYYYNDPGYTGSRGNEYQEEAKTSESVADSTAETPENEQPENVPATESAADTTKPAEA